MRIGIYAPNMTTPAPSGVERYAGELIRALGTAGGGHEFVVFSDADGPVGWRRVAVPPMGWFARLRFDHGGLARLAAKEQLDVLHCTKTFVPAGLDCPAVSTVYDVIFLREPSAYPFWWRWYWTGALERSIERAAAVIGISETTARDLQGRFPAAREKIRAVPAGVESSAFSVPSGRAAELRRAMGVGDRYFLSVGNLTARKNLPALLDAFGSIREKSRAELVIVGAPDYGSKAILRRMGEAGIRYLARVGDPELAALYEGALALAYPSVYEGFGLPVLEAMAAGCPVVTTSGGALPEVVGDAGLLVGAGDAPALAGALERVAADPGLRAQLASKGRARAAEFTWERTAERTLGIYEQAGARTGAGTHEAAARP